MRRRKPDPRQQAFNFDKAIPLDDAPSARLMTFTCWRCGDCGQIQFVATDEKPSGYCPYCKDMRTWERRES